MSEPKGDHRRAVVVQIAVGMALIPVLGAALWFVLPDYHPTSRGRVVFVSLGVVALPLVFGIQRMLFRRFESSTLIQGRRRDEPLSADEAFLANTVEQTLLAAIAILVCGFGVPAAWLELPVIGAMLFLIGRAAFFVGYRVDPMRRFVGFVLGHYTSLALLVIGLWFGIAPA